MRHLIRPTLLWLVFFALLLLVYSPALRGGILWDDARHITTPELRSLGGLWRIWFEIGATQQYYPLLHSAFWAQWWLWGEKTTGYHLVNVALHAMNAVLLWGVVRRLLEPSPPGRGQGEGGQKLSTTQGESLEQWVGVRRPLPGPLPGGEGAGIALLAAAIWAFHPVMVESVAWITELKNTLSTAFYLGAMLCFWQGGKKAYAASLGLFICALLSKTVTATLPGALLVIAWWRNGRIGWREIKPTLPMWLLGAAGGLLTAWVERRYIGAEGADYGLNLLERTLLAGRVVWFYVGKLFWPAELMFLYPKWEIHAGDWRQWMGVVGGLLVVGGVWFGRPFGAAAKRLFHNSKEILKPPMNTDKHRSHSTFLYRCSSVFIGGFYCFCGLWRGRYRGYETVSKRGILAAAMVFVGSLLPVLGFFNVFPFVYSYVADHFQYLASMAVITAMAALLARWKISWVIVPVLAVLSWREAGQYADAATLWQRTLERNPACWMAHNNYGAMLLGEGRVEEARLHLQAALNLNGEDDVALANLAAYHAHQRDYPAAVEYQRRAAELMDRQADIPARRIRRARHHFRLGRLLSAWGVSDPAVAAQAAQQAVDQFSLTIQLDPDFGPAYHYLGDAYVGQRRFQQAIEILQAARRLLPKEPLVLMTLATAYAELKQYDLAIAYYQQALQLDPSNTRIRELLESVIQESGMR